MYLGRAGSSSQTIFCFFLLDCIKNTYLLHAGSESKCLVSKHGDYHNHGSSSHSSQALYYVERKAGLEEIIPKKTEEKKMKSQ